MHLPAELGAVELRDRRLDADVVALVVGEPARRRRASPPGRTRTPAMNAIFCATASCLPTGRPHWTRSADHSRAILVAHLALADADRGQREAAGVERRERDLQPLALACRSGSRPGRRRPRARVTEFSIPRRPMNALRCSTVTPSVS